MQKPAIVVVGYNRPDSLKRLLNSITKANYSDYNDIVLIISLDKAENEKDVLKVANDFQWNHGKKIIRTFDERQGLRKHIIQCGDLTKKYDSVIILEDDLIVSPNYYIYVENALRFYKNHKKIAGIALYSHEWNGYSGTFFQPIADSYDTYMGQFSITWGQCWTKASWDRFKIWYDKNDNNLQDNVDIPNIINKWSNQSWGKYFVHYIVENDLYYVIPRVSLSTNFSDIGQHAKQINSDHQVRILCTKNYNYRFAPFEQAQRYDIFFENKNLSKNFNNDFNGDEITIDLNGYGRVNKNNRYLLSTLYLPYKIIKHYGLQMRPIDANVINNIEGNDIFLYDLNYYVKRKLNLNYNHIRYNIRGISNKKLLKYLKKVIKIKLISKLTNNKR